MPEPEDYISALSREQVRAVVTAEDLDVATIKTYTVKMAVLLPAATPVTGDWKTAAWGSDTDQAEALLQVGPGSASALVLTAASRYAVYVQVTGGGHIPVIKAGFIRTY